MRQFAFPQRLKPEIRNGLSTYGLKPVPFKGWFLDRFSDGSGATSLNKSR